MRPTTRWMALLAILLVLGGALAMVFSRAMLRPASPARVDTPADAAADARATREHAASTAATSMPRDARAQASEQADAAPDTRRQQLIGVRTARVVEADVAPAVRTTGIVKYDERRQTVVAVKVDGWIRDLFVDFTGAPVRKGQPLFTLYSPELVAAQQEYLLARRAASATGASATDASLADARRYADRLIDAARQRLARWDVSPEQIRALDAGGPPQEAQTIRSPADGLVLDKTIVRGMHVTAGQSLYKLVDPSTVWVEADIREADLSTLGGGAGGHTLRAAVTFDAVPGRTFAGRVTFIAPALDAQARTAAARVELRNPDGVLKPGMFGIVSLTPPATRGLVIPADALLDSGTEQTVFLAAGDGRFEPRRVAIGRRLDDVVEIRDGLRVGDEVARSATFFLDADSQLRSAMEGYASGAGDAIGGASGGGSLTLRMLPDPPRAGGGDTRFEVQLRDAAGAPIDDAAVRVVFYMAAMPSMNMPAMRTATALASEGGGLYRGLAQILMSGRWDVSVTATRNGQRVATRRQTVVVP